ncbi:hypothetical protein ACP70R_003055 [Stipagrostis hirtigluma subsp. patula]
MAKYVKNASQGLLLFSLVLLACSAIPALNGRSIDSMKSEMEAGTNSIGVKDDDRFNGCYENHQSSNLSAVFCCRKDNLCWGSLPECVPNCPCKVNCGGKASIREAELYPVRG